MSEDPTELVRQLSQAHSQVEALRADLTAQKARYVSQWRRAKQDGDKATERLYAGYITEIDRALLTKNWIQLKWESEFVSD